jgi:hypothetical protein
MASAPQANLPLFYKDLTPVNPRDHGTWSSHRSDFATWLVGSHAIPVTVDEFGPCARYFPIVFSAGENPVPLALMGLNEGINVYVGDDGKVLEEIYLPAYVRRYPFLLAKIDPSSDNMSLCVDPSSDLVGELKDGTPFFENDKPSDNILEIMKFCERFEEAGQRTQAFLAELKKQDLLMDGEVAIQRDGQEQPYIYRGFKMINQEKFREVRGDLLRTWNQNGMLSLIFAHLLSLDLLRVIFARQTAQGKGPGAQPAAPATEKA